MKSFEEELKQRGLLLGSGESLLEVYEFFDIVQDEIMKLKSYVNYHYDDERQEDAEKRIESDLVFSAFRSVLSSYPSDELLRKEIYARIQKRLHG